MKSVPIIAALLILIGGIGYVMFSGDSDLKLSESPLDATYVIEGESVTIAGGAFEKEAAPGSATKIKISVFGVPTAGDIDGDGDEDAALLLVRDPGGSGTFYYVAAAFNTGGGYQGTNAVFLGDRIAPHLVEISEGRIIANYAERKPGEPISARPSVGQSKYLTVSGGELVESEKIDGDDTVLEAALNQTVRGGGVSITPLEVLEDSRCPADVVCVWMGQVRLKAKLSTGLGEAEQIFISGQTITSEAEEIILSRVLPTAYSSQEIKPSDYRFQFTVSKRNPWPTDPL